MNVNGMNNPELGLLTDYPMLRRISSSQNPREVEIIVPVRHNPDFAYFDPANGRGIYVEVKGVIHNRMWIPMLAASPEWFKQIYKVVLVTRSKKERNKIKHALDKAGIEWYDDCLNPQWIVYAAKLYTGLVSLDFDDTENNDNIVRPCPHLSCPSSQTMTNL